MQPTRKKMVPSSTPRRLIVRKSAVNVVQPLQTARQKKLAVALPTMREAAIRAGRGENLIERALGRKECVACGGSGTSSKGGECVPCVGTGKVKATSGTPSIQRKQEVGTGRKRPIPRQSGVAQPQAQSHPIPRRTNVDRDEGRGVGGERGGTSHGIREVRNRSNDEVKSKEHGRLQEPQESRFLASLKAELAKPATPMTVSRPGKAATGHLIARARAGTGKTTSGVEGLHHVRGTPTGLKGSPQQEAIWAAMKNMKKPESIAFLAFNRPIANTLKKKVPEGVEASTMHAFGLGAINRSGKRAEIVKEKIELLLEAYEGKPAAQLWEHQAVYTQNCIRLTDLVRMTLAGYENEQFEIDAVTPAVIQGLADNYELTLEGKELETVPILVDRCRRDRKTIDFADMVWQPIVNKLPVKQYDLLCVDEGQDLNRCQQELALRAGRRIILFGDDRQAIYGFAGADTESIPRMQSFLEERGGCSVLPLTVSRRCGKRIVEEAKAIVEDFEAHESNPLGVIIQADADKMFENARGGDMVLCRVNAHSCHVCVSLAQGGPQGQHPRPRHREELDLPHQAV